MMKFSVIVPVYNALNYLEECCNSVLSQSYQNYELLLIDDGSSDGSGALCDQISARAPGKCAAVHTPNQGPLLARQTGIRAATGEILVFLDADDCLRRDALETLADCFCRTGCDMVLYNASDREDFSNRVQSFPFPPLFCMEGREKSRIYRLIAHSKIPNSVCLKAAQKRCLADMPDFAGLSYVKNGEDLLMSLHMVTAAQKIVNLDETLYFYRQREGSSVHSFQPDRARSIKKVHQEMERFIDEWGMPELRPAHYARQVHGWVETMVILLSNKEHMDPAEFRQQLQALATDEYFLHAYALMEPGLLSRKYRLLAKWLRNRQYWLLHMAAFLKKIKSLLKGNN